MADDQGDLAVEGQRAPPEGRITRLLNGATAVAGAKRYHGQEGIPPRWRTGFGRWSGPRQRHRAEVLYRC